jgi:hypothetical protein
MQAKLSPIIKSMQISNASKKKCLKTETKMTTTDMLGRCELCERQAMDTLNFAAGDDAEYTVLMPLCEAHLQEAEELGYGFEDKYAAEILECLYEHWRGLADQHDDRNK